MMPSLTLGTPDINGIDALAAMNGMNGVSRSPTTPIPTPRQIMDVTDSHERYRQPLRDRMEADWETLVLKEFDAGAGYQSYTSNEPMTYFNKMTSSLASGNLKIRIPTEQSHREEREREAAAERFYIGILAANDERLKRLGQPRLQDTLSGFVNVRGWYCGRALLVKDLNTGETYPDITPWDPLHVSWGMGAKGLKWACHKTKMTPAEIQDQYGVNAASGLRNTSPDSYFDAYMKDEVDGVDVYDWWDQTHNMVVANNLYLKPPTVHSPIRRTPIFFGAVGPMPLIQSIALTGQWNLTHQGESIFAPNRSLYEKLNLVCSTMLQLVALSRNQAFYITSRDGQKQLKQNPSLEGSQFALAEGEKFNIIPLLEMAKDTTVFLGLLSAEIQRGALPYSLYGQLAFQLSGYAVSLLKQATDSPLWTRQQAVVDAYSQITSLIGDQFATGAYGAMQLRGFGQNRRWFDEGFEPQLMVGLPAAHITLSVKTPQDDMQKMQLAKMAREGTWPVYDDATIWDDILGVQDTDSLNDAIKEQVGERLLPEAALNVLMNALMKRGRGELAELYYGKLQQVAMFGQAGPPGLNGGNQNGKAGGIAPETLSAPEQGAPMPEPTPQGGANVSAGTPRPAAQRPNSETLG